MRTAPLSRGLLALLSLCAMAGGETPPPAPRISVTAPVVVSGDLPKAPHVEPTLAAHPTDARLLFGAAIAFSGTGPGQGLDSSVIAGFRSADGGLTWSRVALPACRIDPWARFGGDGSLYLACLGKESPLVLYRSADDGRTWEEPRRVPVSGGGVDRPVLSVGRAPGASRETVYVGFGQYSPAPGLARPAYGAVIAQSPDGRTFAEPAPLRHDNLGQQPFDSVVLSSGVYLLFSMDYTDQSERLLAHRRTWAIKTGDGGRTWSLPALVFEQTGQEMPWSVAADPSPLHRDRLYLAVDGRWQRQRSATSGAAVPGSRGGLFVLISDDGAESWRSAGTLSDAPPGADAATPAIAINRDGVVGVAWYDTRRDPRGECFDLYFTASLDGGATFLPEVRVTPEPSCPSAVERQRGVAARWPFGGDYSGLAAAADGNFHLFWADSSGGGYQILSAVARVLDSLPPSRY